MITLCSCFVKQVAIYNTAIIHLARCRSLSCAFSLINHKKRGQAGTSPSRRHVHPPPHTCAHLLLLLCTSMKAACNVRALYALQSIYIWNWNANRKWHDRKWSIQSMQIFIPRTKYNLPVVYLILKWTEPVTEPVFIGKAEMGILTNWKQ